MKKLICFDLDGTLIYMDQDVFIREYFATIIAKLTALGYDGERVRSALECSVRATMRNDGSITNEERFWQTFAEVEPDIKASVEGVMREYYAADFDRVISASCHGYDRAREIVECVKNKGRDISS